MLQIGITGGIGSGKTLVCTIFEKLGIPVYNADQHAKSIMNNDFFLKEQIIKYFGTTAYTSENTLNNVFLAKEVFNDSEKLSVLNSLVHPLVSAHFQQWVQAHLDFQYVIKEAALLVENGSYTQLNKLVVVTAPEEVRIERVLLRDKHRTFEQVQAIIQKQLPEEKKIAVADYVVINDDKNMVIQQVLALHKIFTKTT